MSKIITKTPEYKQYQVLEHWKPVNEVILVKELSDSKNKWGSLFSYVYKKTKAAYYRFPDRRDGQDSFVHPLNLVWDLKRAKIDDYATLCAGLLHDYVEEMVDLYKKEQKVQSDKEGIKELDKYELVILQELKEELLQFCQSKKIEISVVEEILELIKLLTRHKRHFYYRSISEIFHCKDEKLKEKAIQIKLADRIHNIQSLKSFDVHGQVYQCFKNLFIINNAKKYLIDKYGEDTNRVSVNDPTQKVFIKCCKATYDAYLNVCDNCIDKGIKPIRSMLQLAFRKFVSEKSGLWAVTKLDEKEFHPMRLYYEIVRKYDARLHQEKERFDQMQKSEMEYCRKFFADFNFTEDQLQAIIDYKDAYALKEVVARLLYKRRYTVSGFGCSDLCSRRMICMKI